MKRTLATVLVVLALAAYACAPKAALTPTPIPPTPTYLTFVIEIERQTIVEVQNAWMGGNRYGLGKWEYSVRYGESAVLEGTSEAEVINIFNSQGYSVRRMEPGNLEKDNPELTAYPRLWVLLETSSPPNPFQPRPVVVLWRPYMAFIRSGQPLLGTITHNGCSQEELVEFALNSTIFNHNRLKVKVEVEDEEIRLTIPSTFSVGDYSYRSLWIGDY